MEGRAGRRWDNPLEKGMSMHISSFALGGLLLLSAASAQAQTEPPKPLTVTGSVGLVSDYRFRGVSQSDKEPAVQGGVTVTHRSGAYAGFWASNLAGWGTFGGPNLELDLVAGYALPVGGGAIDVGATWYMYPGGADTTDFIEPYAKLSGTIGPAKLLAGIAYAPKQEALGNAQIGVHPDARPGDKDDNLYLWGDAAIGIPGSPVTAKAHIGHSDGNPGLGPNGTSVTPTGGYWDWSLGGDVVVGPVTLGIAYVDTDIGRAESAYLLPNFASTKNGSSIAAGQVVFSLSAGF